MKDKRIVAETLVQVTVRSQNFDCGGPAYDEFIPYSQRSPFDFSARDNRKMLKRQTEGFV